MKWCLVLPFLGALVSASNQEIFVPQVWRTLEGIQAVINKSIQPHSRGANNDAGKSSFLERTSNVVKGWVEDGVESGVGGWVKDGVEGAVKAGVVGGAAVEVKRGVEGRAESGIKGSVESDSSFLERTSDGVCCCRGFESAGSNIEDLTKRLSGYSSKKPGKACDFVEASELCNADAIQQQLYDVVTTIDMRIFPYEEKFTSVEEYEEANDITGGISAFAEESAAEECQAAQDDGVSKPQGDESEMADETRDMAVTQPNEDDVVSQQQHEKEVEKEVQDEDEVEKEVQEEVEKEHEKEVQDEDDVISQQQHEDAAETGGPKTKRMKPKKGGKKKKKKAQQVEPAWVPKVYDPHKRTAKSFYLEWAFKLKEYVQEVKKNGLLKVQDAAIDNLEDDGVFTGTPQIIAFWKMRFKVRKLQKLMKICVDLKDLLETDASWATSKPLLPILQSAQEEVQQTIDTGKVDTTQTAEKKDIALKDFYEMEPTEEKATEYNQDEYEAAEKDVDELIQKLHFTIQPLYESQGQDFSQVLPALDGPDYDFWTSWAFSHRIDGNFKEALTRSFDKLLEKVADGDVSDPPSRESFDIIQNRVDSLQREEQKTSKEKYRDLNSVTAHVDEPGDVDQDAKRILDDRLLGKGALSEEKHLENFANVKGMIGEAFEAKTQGQTEGGWLHMLNENIRKIVAEDSLLAEVLKVFGWTGEAFKSPPELQKLQEMLEMPDLKSIRTAVEHEATMQHPCVKVSLSMKLEPPGPFTAGELYTLSADHFKDLRKEISNYLKQAQVNIDAKDIAISDLDTAAVIDSGEIPFLCALMTPEGDINEAYRVRDILRMVYEKGDQGIQKDGVETDSSVGPTNTTYEKGDQGTEKDRVETDNLVGPTNELGSPSIEPVQFTVGTSSLSQRAKESRIAFVVTGEAVTAPITTLVENYGEIEERQQCCCPETRSSSLAHTYVVEWMTHEVPQAFKVNSVVQVVIPDEPQQSGTIIGIAPGPTYTVKLGNEEEITDVPHTSIQAGDELLGVECESWKSKKSEWARVPNLEFVHCVTGNCPSVASPSWKDLMRRVENPTHEARIAGAQARNRWMGYDPSILSADMGTEFQTETPPIWSPMGVQLPMEGFMAPPGKILPTQTYANAYSTAYAALTRPRLVPVVIR